MNADDKKGKEPCFYSLFSKDNGSRGSLELQKGAQWPDSTTNINPTLFNSHFPTPRIQGHPWQSVYFGVKILGRKKVLRIIYTLDFLFPEKHISFAITSFSRFLHFRKKVSWFQLFLDIFSKKNFVQWSFAIFWNLLNCFISVKIWKNLLLQMICAFKKKTRN